jgi:membrane protein DedA with SNARE-associated domain
MLTELISDVATNVLTKTGYSGAGGLMALESMIAPVPSEAVMPFVGFQVRDGHWNLWLAILATSIGSLVGSLLSYLMGYYGGKPFVLKVGKYLLLSQRDLEKTETFFHAHRGIMTIFISRFIPVVRHFISIPAGIGKMPIIPFCLVSVLGATMWNTFLLGCGWFLRDNWRTVKNFTKIGDLIIIVLFIIGTIWFVRKRLKEARTTNDQ